MPARATTSPILDDLLCFDLYATSRAMTATYRPLLEPHGLTYPQYLVLEVLLRSGPQSIRHVGAALHLDHGTLTPLLRRMAERDLVHVSASPSDARARVVRLGPAGEALREVCSQVHCRVAETVDLTDAELESLQTTLRTLAARLGRAG